MSKAIHTLEAAIAKYEKDTGFEAFSYRDCTSSFALKKIDAVRKDLQWFRFWADGVANALSKAIADSEGQS